MRCPPRVPMRRLHAYYVGAPREGCPGPGNGQAADCDRRHLSWWIFSEFTEQPAKEATGGQWRWSLLSALLPQTMLLADRGYNADWIRELARQQGAWANIPPKRNRKDPICFSPHLYRARNLVERVFNKIKQCRRVATQCDKLAANYLAFIKLASIRIWLRANESTPQ
jgi:transposase